MKTQPMNTTLMTTSTVTCLTSNSWLMVWISLEMNTMAFSSMLTTKKNKSESPMKYFLVQSTASAIMLASTMMEESETSKAVLTMAIMMKMAAAPLHTWFIEMTEKMSEKNLTVLMTWQKMAPAFIMSMNTSKMTTTGVIMSAIVGSMSQYTTTKTKKMMGLSSVFNMSWIITSTQMGTKTTLSFMMMYWIPVATAMWMVKKTKMKTNSKMSENKWMSWLSLMNMSSLAGMPPTMGFLPKWYMSNMMTKTNMKTILTGLLITSSINMYIYLRMMSKIISLTPQKKKNETQKSTKMTKTSMWINTPMVMMMATLSQTKKKG